MWGCFALAAVLTGCSKLSDDYSRSLKPLHIVTYVTTGNQVIKKKAYFGDSRSNVIVLTDDARDGLLPYGDEDRLVDQVSVEVYNRGLLLDFLICRGVISSNHIAPQKVKALRNVNPDAIKILTDKFIRQNNFVKTASAKYSYEVVLKSIDTSQAGVVIAVDGQEGHLNRGVLQRVGSVYVMLDQIERLEDAGDLEFAVVRISNQSILLKTGQRARVAVDGAEVRNAKLVKSEKVNFFFVVGDTAPDKEACEREDIFHSFLVDRPDNEHVSYYRMVREQAGPANLTVAQASGYRMVDEPFEEAVDPGIVKGIQGNINMGIREAIRFLSGVTDKAIPILGFDSFSK